MKKDITKVVDVYTIKERDNKIKVSDLIKALKKHKDKKLSMNIWILEREGNGKTLIGDTEILGGVNEEGTFMFTLLVGEDDLEDNEIDLKLWKDGDDEQKGSEENE